MYRKILIEKNEYSKNYNRDFNTKIKSISDEIFQTKEVFPAGYKAIGSYDTNQKKYAVPQDGIDIINAIADNDRIDESWSDLSEYEKIIASHLLYGFYETYIFSGGMGTGKTSTANHVMNFIRKKYEKSNSAFIEISFDFNGFASDKDDNGNSVIHRFKENLFYGLKYEIVNYIVSRDYDVLKKFVTYLKGLNFKKHFEFFDLFQIINTFEWIDFSPKKRADSFMHFIEANSDFNARVVMLLKFLGFVRFDMTEDEFIVLFYDNIDILEPAVQNRIFQDYILPYNINANLFNKANSKVNCLISLRRTTFRRAIDYIDINNAQSFGFIHHHGHNVSEILTQRLEYWINNIESAKITKNLKPKYKLAIKNRLSFLHNEFTQNTKNFNSLKEYINAFSGNSIRLGLYMAHRFLINNIIKYDENPSQRDRYKKSFIVKIDNNLLLPNAEEIANLFAYDNAFSLLPLRVLHFINESFLSQQEVTINDILLHPFFKRTTTRESIIQTIKMLMHSRRPLIFTSKAHDNYDLNTDASLYITEIGDGYLSMLRWDLTYVQECLMVVKWDSEIVPQSLDVQNEFQRLSSVIKCLRAAFDEDYDQCKDYEKHGFALPFPLSVASIIEKILPTIFSLNNVTLNSQPLSALIQELATYIVNVKNVDSAALSELIDKLAKRA